MDLEFKYHCRAYSIDTILNILSKRIALRVLVRFLNFDRVETVAIKNGIIAILNSKLAPS